MHEFAQRGHVEVTTASAFSGTREDEEWSVDAEGSYRARPRACRAIGA